MDQLNVVNRMLAKMGEVPVESVTEDHDFIPACLRTLNDTSRKVQARGWWFNTEQLSIDPDGDGFINLPGDVLAVRSESRWHVKRGDRMYDTENGTDVFTDSVDLLIVRELAFDDLVPEAQDYIAEKAVAEFQSDYDGDNTKTRRLDQEVARCLIELNAAHTRAVQFNAIWNNPRLARMHRVTRGVRNNT